MSCFSMFKPLKDLETFRFAVLVLLVPFFLVPPLADRPLSLKQPMPAKTGVSCASLNVVSHWGHDMSSANLGAACVSLLALCKLDFKNDSNYYHILAQRRSREGQQLVTWTHSALDSSCCSYMFV